VYYPFVLIASMHASPSKPFNLDFTLLSHTHHLDDLRQRVFQVSSWLLQVTHHVCALVVCLNTPFIKLS
jgi:hypothetical protein